eukprot:Gregarina_sp_Poly_1__6671@NODE_3596_length_987_cov_59_029348_g2006_i1_p1_GENE_NODE_3596_length_987_cov_59_029348_g2006_i1NODE_3596_length_987_cov_59_029348_g2006_i1_p1_ORF_typecomplete_len131_score12_89_NODE_3596_length_987_cov_59_029348_g2006_i178470
MQTLLAAVGVIAFWTSTSSNDPELDRQILLKVITIFGDDFEKRFAETMRPEIVNVNDADDNDIANRRHGSAQMRVGNPRFTKFVSHYSSQFLIFVLLTSFMWVYPCETTLSITVKILNVPICLSIHVTER